MKATSVNGVLERLTFFYLIIPVDNNEIKIYFNNINSLTDSKSATYSEESVPGRSFPVKFYSQSDNRTIGLKIKFIAGTENELGEIVKQFRAIQSAVYPREGDDSSPYFPPPICKLRYGFTLSKDEICVIIKSYSVTYPDDVAWSEKYLMPYAFEVDVPCEQVFRSSNLPGQSKIFGDIGFNR